MQDVHVQNIHDHELRGENDGLQSQRHDHPNVEGLVGRMAGGVRVSQGALLR